MSADPPSNPLATDPDSAIGAFRLRFRAALQKIGATRSSIWPEYWPQGPLIRILFTAHAGVSLPDRLDPIGVVCFAETGEFTSPVDWHVTAQRLGLCLTVTEALRRASDEDDASAWRRMLVDEVGRLPPTEASAGSDGLATLVVLGVAGSVVLLLMTGIVGAIQWARNEPFPLPTYDLVQAAVTPCRTYVKSRLKTPGTATFPWRRSADIELRSRSIPGGTRYEVVSFVDAENEFGASVRHRFYCSVDRIARFNGLPGLFVSVREWPAVDLRLAPWVATTREDRLAQASWAVAVGDDVFLRDLAADWIRTAPSDPHALVAEAVSRYWDRDFAHVSRTMGGLLAAGRLPAEWDRTAKAIYAGALAEQELQGQRELGAKVAMAAFVSTTKPSLFSQALDSSFDQWARAISTSAAAQ